jgi:hypothetical protein
MWSYRLSCSRSSYVPYSCPASPCRHFGKGQTSADIELSSGTHKLTLQFADAEHRSYGPEYSDEIVIEVIDPPLVKQQIVRDPPTLEEQGVVSPNKKLQL